MTSKDAFSFLDEIKDLASREAQSEPLHQSEDVKSLVKPSSSLGNLTSDLSAALSDVHLSILQDAQEEETSRAVRLEEEEHKRKSEQHLEAQKKQEELEVRLAAEHARQQAIDEERRLKRIQLDYEAALDRGEDVELPVELRPPEPAKPVVVETPKPSQQEIQAEIDQKKNNMLFVGGGVVALAMVAAGVFFFLQTTPPVEPIKGNQVNSMISFEKSQAEAQAIKVAEAKRKAKEEQEAQERAEIARVEAEKLELAAKVEADKKRARRKSANGRRSKRKKPKKKINVKIEGF